ncbi:hypothetical protein [Aromatoleum evansii]|uniref:hypothetical protein n=1 Tax=Aromatoleum evansii TaxID=59406 RepID=UPI00145D745C|nr:hypothetical protein [Aromatoleum evansii]NMG30590.1 hypothetical protein [Aromatoleum evansii]
MRLRALVCPLGLLPLLSSCAYVNPYVLPETQQLCPKGKETKGCKELSTVVSSIAKLETSRKSVKGKLDDTTFTSRGLDLFTFGFVTAFAVRGVHEAAIGAGAKNLALAGGASYTAGKLFAAPSTEQLYLGAHSALTCVMDRGNAVIGVYEQAHILKERVTQAAPAVKSANCKQVLGDKLVGEFRSAHAKAIGLPDTIKSLDAAIGSDLQKTGGRILEELNSQLNAQRPNLDAILNAGTGVSSIAGSLVASGSSQWAGVAGDGDVQKQQQQDCSETPESVGEQIEAVKGMDVLWKSTVNAIGDLKDGCAMAPASLAPLAVAQNAVTLVPGTTFNLVYGGGRPPIHAQWVNDIPRSDQLSLTPHPGSSMFQITRPPSDRSATTFTLRVFDSAAIPSSTEVSVAVPAPAK